MLQLEGWAELASQSGTDEIMAKRLASFDMMNSALRLGVLDIKDKITTRGGQSLSGIDSTLETLSHFVAAACDIPITILLDMSPGSLNATGDMNVRNWYASVENDREKKYKPRLAKVLRWLMLSTAGPLGGVLPPQWSVKFRPLWTPSEKEQEETRKTTAERDKLYFDMGVNSADDVATSRFGGDTYSAETSIDWAARKAQQAADEVQAAQLDGAALAAMGRAQAMRTGDSVQPELDAPRADEDGLGIGIKFAGLPIVVENAKGTRREWPAPDGTVASTKMRYDYGYITGAKGADGDSVDVYLGPSEDAKFVYIVKQQAAPDFTTYDEDKVMLGFDSENHAKDAYLAQYDDERFFGSMEMVTLDAFKALLESADD